MRAENDGPFAPKLADQIPDVDNLLRVESVCRLVEDDDLRIADDGAGDSDSLAVALGEIFDHSVHGVLDFDDPTDFRNVFLAVKRAFFQIINEIQVFLDRHFKVKRRHFRQKADFFLDGHRMLQYIESVDHGSARCGGKISRENVHGRGLARAVRPEKTDNLSFFHLKAYSV